MGKLIGRVHINPPAALPAAYSPADGPCLGPLVDGLNGCDESGQISFSFDCLVFYVKFHA
jgi:hypothetical protein